MAWAGKGDEQALGKLKKKYRAINRGVSSVMDLLVARDSINLISRFFFLSRSYSAMINPTDIGTRARLAA